MSKLAMAVASFGMALGGLDPIANRPYLNDRGIPCIRVNTGQLDKNGFPLYAERQIQANATLRKDDWINLDAEVLKAARERLVIVEDMISAGLSYNVGGLGVQIAEWETASEITDAEATMDGESKVMKDRQEFGLNGVPIPILHKDFSIGERTLLASRQRGAGLDVTTGEEAARAVARKSESMIFNGIPTLGSVNTYQVYGLLTYPNKPVDQISDWANPATTPATILADILALVSEMETEQRAYGPFTLYIPAAYSARFREDFKANSDKTLMQRVLDEPVIKAVRVADALSTGYVVLVEMTRRTFDLAIASDLTTVQWASGSGFTNHFKTYAAWAPRIKQDFDGRMGYIVGAVTT